MNRLQRHLLYSTALFTSCFLAVSIAHADTSAPAKSAKAAASASPDDKLDVTDLEKKYWSAKDTDFSVVQNRLYSKAGRFSLGVSYGMYSGESWSTGPTLGVAGSYFFSERYGAQLTYSTTQSIDTDAVSNLKTVQGGAPDANKMKQFYGASFNWVPFYAKMSVLNSAITYFDMAISPGLGMVQYQQQLEEGNGTSKWAPCATIDITQHYFVNNHFALRFEFDNRFYPEDVTQYHAPTTGRTSWTSTNHTSLIIGGLEYFF